MKWLLIECSSSSQAAASREGYSADPEHPTIFAPKRAMELPYPRKTPHRNTSISPGRTLLDSYATAFFPVAQGPKGRVCDRSTSWGIPQRDIRVAPVVEPGWELGNGHWERAWAEFRGSAN